MKCDPQLKSVQKEQRGPTTIPLVTFEQITDMIEGTSVFE